MAKSSGHGAGRRPKSRLTSGAAVSSAEREAVEAEAISLPLRLTSPNYRPLELNSCGPAARLSAISNAYGNQDVVKAIGQR